MPKVREPYPPAARGMVLGLVTACALGGLAMVAFGAFRLAKGVDCEGLSDAECTLQQEVLVGFAKRQLLFGGALSVFGVAAYVLTRDRMKPGDGPPERTST